MPVFLGSSKTRNLWKLTTLLFVIGVSPFLSGCLGTYLVKSSYHQMKLLSERKPLKEVLADPNLKESTKKKLKLAQKAKAFAEEELNLKPSDNYGTFVDIKRPYVTYIVRVAYRDRLEGKDWWYPIVGSLPYKGFFTKQEAIDEAKTFDKNVYDTYVRGATAYSTLGWFDDPILSSMLSYGDSQLVNLIIHESVHATLFIKGQASFNERLATFLGNIGTEIYYRKQEGETSQTVENIEKGNRDKKRFSIFISAELKALKKWYKENKGFSPEEKKARLKAIQARFVEEVRPTMERFNYAGFAKTELNNAQLLSYSTYVSDLSDFEQMYELQGRNFGKFLNYCRSLEDAKDPVKKLKEDIKKLTPNSENSQEKTKESGETGVKAS